MASAAAGPRSPRRLPSSSASSVRPGALPITSQLRVARGRGLGIGALAQGHRSGERRGIFASGWATSDVYQQEHWDEAEARKGKLALYVPIRLYVLLDSDSEEILSRSMLKEGSLSGGPWDARTGGVEIPGEIAAELEREWARLLASKDIVQSHARGVPLAHPDRSGD